jgi:hypothetical protein
MVPPLRKLRVPKNYRKGRKIQTPTKNTSAELFRFFNNI